MTDQENELRDAARYLGRRGGLKGGRARSDSMTAQERSEAARKAAVARWENDPRAPKPKRIVMAVCRYCGLGIDHLPAAIEGERLERCPECDAFDWRIIKRTLTSTTDGSGVLQEEPPARVWKHTQNPERSRGMPEIQDGSKVAGVDVGKRLWLWRIAHRRSKRIGWLEEWTWQRLLAACVRGEQATTGW